MRAIFKKELRSYFTSPVGWFVLAVMFLFSGFAFFMYNMSYGVTTLTYVYQSLYTIILLLVLPIMTMRLFSEEKRQKTDQALLTAPASLTGIVLGKFLAAMLMFVLGLSVTLVYAVIVASKATAFDWVMVIGNFLGLTLLSGMVVAVGMLVSACTESQFISALCTFGISFLLLLLDNLSSIFAGVTWMEPVVSFLSVNTRYYTFTSGLIHVDNIIFFLSLQALFIFLTVRVLDKKRWN